VDKKIRVFVTPIDEEMGEYKVSIPALSWTRRKIITGLFTISSWKREKRIVYINKFFILLLIISLSLPFLLISLIPREVGEKYCCLIGLIAYSLLTAGTVFTIIFWEKSITKLFSVNRLLEKLKKNGINIDFVIIDNISKQEYEEEIKKREWVRHLLVHE
jgi:hypothetical protein